jgi:beta-hydroxylase
VDWINRLFSRIVLGASATKNIDGDKIGFLNRIFSSIYKIRILGKKIKAYNRKLYYTLQYGLYAWLIYLIFF